MIRVICEDPGLSRDIVSMIRGAGGEDAAAGPPDEVEPMPSLLVAYGLEAIRSVCELAGRRGEHFQPVMGLVSSMEEAEKARECGVSDVAFYPTGREELVFRAVRIMGDSVFRVGDAVVARHLLRFLLAWSHRSGDPFSLMKVVPADDGSPVPRDLALDLMINLRLSDHICHLASGGLLVLMPQTSREQAQVALERLRRKVPALANGELELTYNGGTFGNATAEELLERL